MRLKNLLLLTTMFFLSNLNAQSNQKLESILEKKYPENSIEDGRWVFYSDEAFIEKIEMPLVKTIIPNYDFYKVTMTNFLGHHVNQGTCLVLVDTMKSQTILVEPLWYNEVSENFIKLFIHQKFETKEALVNFMAQLMELMQIDSKYKFIQTSYSDNLITFDLVYFKGDSYTTNGLGTSSTIRYNNSGVSRKVKVDLKNFEIIRYTIINENSGGKVIIK